MAVADQPDLFTTFADADLTAPREGMVAKNPTATSARAARRVEPKTGTQRGKVLTALVEHGGLTDLELAEKLGLLENSVRPRRTELCTGQYARDSGRVREHRGSQWVVWEATDAGRAWWTRNVSNAA
jgi:predicted ArsR family transcriptional regulator